MTRVLLHRSSSKTFRNALYGGALLSAFTAVTLLFATLSLRAEPFETKARQAIMMDAATGTILFSKNPDEQFPPAALAKLMTMEVVFHAIRDGKYKLDDTFVVSENAWRTGGAPSGGSTMFAKLGSKISLGDLIQAVIVQSANDGCIVIAEGMAGSEDGFAAMMNQRAQEIGLKNSVFRNATGLPADGQVVTARDLVTLATYIWKTYPEFYKSYARRDFTWNKITQRNRNPLLAMDIGADGMNTGYTDASGYAIVGSNDRDGRRSFVAMSGIGSERERATEARRLFDWRAKTFREIHLFGAGAHVGDAIVYGGDKPSVPLTTNGPVIALLPNTSDPVSVRIVYDGPLSAPVAKGDEVAELKIWIGETLAQETALYAAEDVAVGAIHQRAADALAELFTGWLRKTPSS